MGSSCSGMAAPRCKVRRSPATSPAPEAESRFCWVVMMACWYGRQDTPTAEPILARWPRTRASSSGPSIGSRGSSWTARGAPFRGRACTWSEASPRIPLCGPTRVAPSSFPASPATTGIAASGVWTSVPRDSSSGASRSRSATSGSTSCSAAPVWSPAPSWASTARRWQACRSPPAGNPRSPIPRVASRFRVSRPAESPWRPPCTRTARPARRGRTSTCRRPRALRRARAAGAPGAAPRRCARSGRPPLRGGARGVGRWHGSLA